MIAIIILNIFLYIMINDFDINISIFNNFEYGFNLFEPIIFNSFLKNGLLRI